MMSTEHAHSAAPAVQRRYRRREAAERLTQLGFPIAPATLAKYATVGGGPIYALWGRRPLYCEQDLLAWVETKLSAPKRSTTDAAA